MTEKNVRKNPFPLVVKGIFYVTATFEDKQYCVSNGLSFIRFKNANDDINKGDYVEIHGPVYQRKEAANAIITGEAIVRKLTEEEVNDYKAKVSACVKAAVDNKKDTKPATKEKKSTAKADNKKMPWE